MALENKITAIVKMSSGWYYDGVFYGFGKELELSESEFEILTAKTGEQINGIYGHGLNLEKKLSSSINQTKVTDAPGK